ncbi:CU044_5270 family protein [Streptomyces sp. DH37]|uniref:CU044_5270 family protein n=1 Tax=Streptomyces sp. DH37 TaxID=3040122 RepID=UPI0024433E61|nr:CU044_5270 family protein [Streptomyces sp. DH37]MDG9703869.1 CU044_5270 family protein [Streptomyces sp. DH37]
MRDTDRLLRGLDPARNSTPVMTDAEAEALLARITATPRQPSSSRARTRRRPLVWTAAVAVTAMAVVGGIGLLDSPVQTPAYAATPAPLHLQDPAGTPAAQLLRQLASKAEQQTAPAARQDATAHFAYEMWSLFTTIDGKRVTSEVVPQRYETWHRPDGSTRQVITWDGGREADDFPAGEQPARPPIGGGAQAMKDWVLSQGDGRGAGAFLSRLNERALNTILSPRQQAGALRALATFDGVEYHGTVRDRSGRPGMAFSTDSDFGGLPKKQTVIFAPDTGKLLAYEEMLTKDAGALNVKIPSVTEYVTHLDHGYTRGG